MSLPAVHFGWTPGGYAAAPPQRPGRAMPLDETASSLNSSVPADASPHLERPAVDDRRHQGCEPVVIARQLAADLLDDRTIGSFEPAPERIREQLLGEIC